MSPHKNIKFPPLTPSQKQRVTHDYILQNGTVETSEGGQEEERAEVSVQPPAATKVSKPGNSYIYASPGRKPQLLVHLESYVKKELQTINSCEPKSQELKLQVYRKVFGIFIKEFQTYQPLLSAIKKEYENTLAYQQDKIRELEPLRSHLRMVTEECDRKIQARWEEEQAEIGALKREKQQLQGEIEAMRKKEKAMQAVVDHLQSELSKQYLQYREEHDARKLLIWQLSDQTKDSVKEEHAAYEDTEEAKDPVELQLTLKVCREDLTKTQEELNRIKAEYWDVVPRRNWDILEQTQQQTLLQLTTLQSDFDQLKSEYDTLLQLHKRGTVHDEIQSSTILQMDECVSQGQNPIQSSQLKEPVNSGTSESGSLTAQEFSTALRTSFPLKSDEEMDELVASTQSDPDNSKGAISSQRPHSLLEEFGAADLPSTLDELEENAASNHVPASD
ncbi:translin-associated factor X-interacting protein 1 isoform X2 [Anabas testudineus]|uniref:translin-associated factor X-interacting protein 1 isoform X2 n=1 Tax=Anabas testudineus TaxID=64144 RepID=UPI000E45B781|nr:translin-associated factor X-interacting protein 1 isoform X2 [Anabas testudineus]